MKAAKIFLMGVLSFSLGSGMPAFALNNNPEQVNLDLPGSAVQYPTLAEANLAFRNVEEAREACLSRGSTFDQLGQAPVLIFLGIGMAAWGERRVVDQHLRNILSAIEHGGADLNQVQDRLRQLERARADEWARQSPEPVVDKKGKTIPNGSRGERFFTQATRRLGGLNITLGVVLWLFSGNKNLQELDVAQLLRDSAGVGTVGHGTISEAAKKFLEERPGAFQDSFLRLEPSEAGMYLSLSPPLRAAIVGYERLHREAYPHCYENLPRVIP